MDYNKPIIDLFSGEQIEGFYVLKSATVKTTQTGKPFLTGIIMDKSGTVEIKMWDYTGNIVDTSIGKVVKLRGDVSEFKGTLQVTVTKLRPADNGDIYNIEDLVPVAPINREQALLDIENLVNSMDDIEYQNICKAIMSKHLDKFKSIPAAKSMHHSFLSGLLMHTYNMLKLADFLADQYSEVIDRNLLISGTLLHDFMKEEEFIVSELGIVTDYSIKGELLGHLVMGAEEVGNVAKSLGINSEKVLLLQHMILSHHGEPELGAAVKPVCAEAELLSYIDLIDSRMEIYAETFLDVNKGELSAPVFGLGNKRLYNH